MHASKKAAAVMPYGHYKLTLLYDGEVVKKGTYYTTLSPSLSFSYGVGYVGTIIGTDSFWIYGAGNITSAQLKLYDPLNPNVEPAYTKELTNSSGRWIVTGTEHDVFKKYYYQLYAGGKVAATSFGNLGEHILPDGYTLPNGEYTVTAKKTEHGSLELSGDTAAYGEGVYVKAIPDDGYEYVPNSVTVNGTPINGRSFFATKNSTVSAEFRKIKKNGYKITVASVSGGEIKTEDEEYAAGETVKVTVTPNDGYKLKTLYYEKTGSSWNTTDIPTDTCEFVMPAYAITIYAEFEQKESYYINTPNYREKSIRITLNDGAYRAYEGDIVKIKVYDGSGNLMDFDEVDKAFYITYSGNCVSIDGDSFVMPADGVTVYCNMKTYHVSIPTAMKGMGFLYYSTHCYKYDDYGNWSLVEGATYLGDCVDVECYGRGSFKPVDGFPKVNGVSIQGTSFVMTKDGALLTAEFESDTFRKITISNPKNAWLSLYNNSPYDDGSGQDAGKTVSVRVTVGNGYRVKSVKYNGMEAEFVSSSWGTATYTFTMPDEDVVITAETEENVWNVTFKNYDGSVLYEQIVKNGSAAEYTGIEPTRPVSDGKAYVFTGWDKEYSSVTEELEITAQYDEYTYKEIKTEDDLQKMSEDLTAYYGLANDIALTKTHTPIGTIDAPFTGVLDGNGHKITNVKTGTIVDEELEEAVLGFFGKISGAVVRNLGLEVVFEGEHDIRGEINIGGIAGIAEDSTVSRCYVTGTINNSAERNNSGGLMGYAIDTNINDCFSNVNVTARSNDYSVAGGLVAWAHGINAENCYNRGTVVAVHANNYWYHPLIGRTDGYNILTTATHCYYLECDVNDGYGKELTAKEMKNCLSYSSYNEEAVYKYYWDFENVWVMDSKQNDGFPMLRFTETDTDVAVSNAVHYPNAKLITFNLGLSKYVKGDTVIAGYKNGKLVACDATYDAEYMDFFNSAAFKLYYEGEAPDTVKVLIWNSKEGMTPVCTAAEINVGAIEEKTN